jgi:hypothetical protein
VVVLQFGFALVESDALHEEEPPNTLLLLLLLLQGG